MRKRQKVVQSFWNSRKKAWLQFPNNRDILGLDLPSDNNFQPITSFVSLALLWQQDSGWCNFAWIRPETRDLLSSRIFYWLTWTFLVNFSEKYFFSWLFVASKLRRWFFKNVRSVAPKFLKKAWRHFPNNRDILGLGLPNDNNFQPVTSFVSLALLWQRDSGRCNLLGYGRKHVTCCLWEWRPHYYESPNRLCHSLKTLRFFHWCSHIGANGATAPLEIAEVEFSKCLNPLSFHFFVNVG